MTTGPRPRKNPEGVLRRLRERSGVEPGDAARALGIPRDSLSRREASPIGSMRIEDAMAHLAAFGSGARLVLTARAASLEDADGSTLAGPESVDGPRSSVQVVTSAESRHVGASGNSPVRAREKGRP